MTKKDPDGTRQRILDAAFQEIYEKGFRAASIDQILADTGLTKGALYHHFPNKNALGYAVIDEVVRGMIDETWIRPMEGAAHPVDGLISTLRGLTPEQMGMACNYGCPLANLAQEMSPIDEGFRVRIEAALDAIERRLGPTDVGAGPRLAYSEADLDRLGVLSRKTRWRRRRDGLFPEPVVSGARKLYRASDIHSWLADPEGWASEHGTGDAA